MKKIILICSTLLLGVGLAGCGNPDGDNKENAQNDISSSISVNKDDNFYKNDVFVLGKEKLSYKITGVKWLASAADNTKKTLVLECDITNNSDDKVDLVSKGNPYMYIHATQKTDNEEKQLQPGTLALDSNGDSPEQDRENTMNSSSVLPHKTVQGVIKFDTVNDSPVTVTFENQSFKVIASKTYNIQ